MPGEELLMAAIPALGKLIPGLGGGGTKVTQSTSLSQNTSLGFSLTNNTGGQGGGITGAPQTITSNPSSTASQTPDSNNLANTLLPTYTDPTVASNLLANATSTGNSTALAGVPIDSRMILIVGGLVAVGVFMMLGTGKKRRG